MREHPGQRGHSRRGGLRAELERRGRPATGPEDREEIAAWFRGSLSEGWFVSAPDVEVDDYEVLVVGTLPDDGLAGADDHREVAESARIEAFRGSSRERRIGIAERAERRFGRAVSWGASVGQTSELFTTASVPFMTRLGMSERRVLDTLVAAGVARSRSEALAWCVELVGRNEASWIGQLRAALAGVDEARRAGPAATEPS